MTDNAAEKNAVLVGVIIAPHGVGGAVSAECLSDNPRRFTAGANFFDDRGQVYTLEQASPHKGRLLLRLKGYADRDSAEKLRGIKLYVNINSDNTDDLPEGEYYHYQLIGMDVRENGESIGRLTEVLSYTANDVFLVKDSSGKEILVPALKAVVKNIDIKAGIMDVDLPEGLR